MTPTDLKILCHALGFTVVVTQSNYVPETGAARARELALLIEQFCRTALVGTFEGTEGKNSGKFVLTERVASDSERGEDLMAQAMAALELCLACKGPLTWEAEHDA